MNIANMEMPKLVPGHLSDLFHAHLVIWSHSAEVLIVLTNIRGFIRRKLTPDVQDLEEP